MGLFEEIVSELLADRLKHTGNLDAATLAKFVVLQARLVAQDNSETLADPSGGAEPVNAYIEHETHDEDGHALPETITEENAAHEETK